MQLGIELPPLSEFQIIHEAMDVGTMIHENIQNVLPKAKLPKDVKFFAEVFVELKVLPNLTIASYIDIAYIKPNKKGQYIEMKPFQFREAVKEVPYLAKGAKFIQIGDIKSASGWSYGKMLEGKISFGYQAQFLYYIKSACLNWLELYAQDKESGRKLRHKYQWEDKVWTEVIEYLNRYVRLVDDIQGICDILEEQNIELNLKNVIDFAEAGNILKAEHCACLDYKHDNIDWWGCPLATNYVFEKKYPKGKQSQKLIKPCETACKKVYDVFTQKFQKGKYYMRQPSESGKQKSTVILKDFNLESDMVLFQRYYIGKGKANKGEMVLKETFIDLPIDAWINCKPCNLEGKELDWEGNLA